VTYGLLPATVLVQDLRAKRASWAPHQGEFWRAVPVSRQAPSTTVSQLHPVSTCPHQGQCGRQVTKRRAWCHRIVAIEAGLWRSGRLRTSWPEIFG
jgi:hypothetical protein